MGPLVVPSFLIPLPQQPRSTTNLSLLSLCKAAVAAKTQQQRPQQSVAESADSLNENVSPMRPHTRRKRRFKRMAVEFIEPSATQDQAGASTGDVMDDKAFSFSTFASSFSSFAKPRQRKVKRKPVNVQK